MNLSNNLYENDAIRASLTRSVDRCNLDDDIPVPVPTSVDKIRTGFELLLPENYSCLFPAVVRERADLYCRIEFRGYIGVNQWGLEFLRELIRGG